MDMTVDFREFLKIPQEAMSRRHLDLIVMFAFFVLLYMVSFPLMFSYFCAHPIHLTHLDFPKQKFRTEVVMFIPTPVPWADRRAFIVNQFQHEKWDRTKVVLVFVFGTRTGPRLEKEIDVSAVIQEQVPGIDYYFSPCRDFGDEENNPNGTSSTTCKVYEACKYIAQTYVADYVWRGADDTYVNLKFFFQMKEESLPSTRLYMGRLRKPTVIDRDLLLENQPRLHELFGLHQFGQYMSGMCYVFSWDVAVFVGTLSIPPRQTWCEDVMIGMWLNPFQIEFFDVGELFYIKHFSVDTWNYRKKYLGVHYMRPQDWKRIDEDGFVWRISN